MQRSAQGSAVEPGRRGSAIDALEGARGGQNLTQPPFTGVVDAAQGNVRRTRAELEVLQDEAGAVLSVRVVRASRLAGFDVAAEEAVRQALPLQASVRMQGGRRSRWSFEVVTSRDPFVPGVGISFDESSGWFEVHAPGRVHTRSRVWLEDARPLGVPAPARGPT